MLDRYGVDERGYYLVIPNGRRLAVNGQPKKVKQPAGQGLALWWPNGPPAVGESALITEGESCALAALSANPALAVGAMPGVPYARRLADDLARLDVAILAFDGDDEGRRATQVAAGAADVACHDLAVPDGLDLADCLAKLEPAERWPWLSDRLSNARCVDVPNPGPASPKSRAITLTRASEIVVSPNPLGGCGGRGFRCAVSPLWPERRASARAS